MSFPPGHHMSAWRSCWLHGCLERCAIVCTGQWTSPCGSGAVPESKARWAHVGPTCSRQDPCWANVGRTKFAVGVIQFSPFIIVLRDIHQSDPIDHPWERGLCDCCNPGLATLYVKSCSTPHALYLGCLVKWYKRLPSSARWKQIK